MQRRTEFKGGFQNFPEPRRSLRRLAESSGVPPNFPEIRRTFPSAVESYSGPDGGIVVYIEGEKRLVLLYSREKDVVFVPADSKWKQVMPEWARDRKNEIVARVKQRHGKRVMGNPIGYEETDLDEWTAPH